MILYKHYDSIGDYSKCIDVLKKYKALEYGNLPEKVNDSIENKINELYSKNIR